MSDPEELINEARDEAKYEGLEDYESCNHRVLVDEYIINNSTYYVDYLDGRVDTSLERDEFIENWKDDYMDFVREDYLDFKEETKYERTYYPR